MIAIEAALTGHLVFSTLHTNDAPGAVALLMDMAFRTVSDCLGNRWDYGTTTSAQSL